MLNYFTSKYFVLLPRTIYTTFFPIPAAHSAVSARVTAIFQREFGTSLREKEEEVETIDARILKVQKALQLVRYGAVANYYATSVAKVIDSFCVDNVEL